MNTAVVAAALISASVTLAHAAGSTQIEIKPGPRAMLPAEKAITADVAKGSQHGVILLEEVVRDDDRGTISQVSYHMRAKILSLEGRRLADIAIPVDRGPGDLKSWWGRTILEDGRVIDLPEIDLKAQTILKTSAGGYQELRGALPGVVPGAVIDFGYVVSSEHMAGSVRVFLQKEWPVRSLRYRWVPNHFVGAAYATSRAEGRAIQVVHDSKSVLVTAQDLEPVPEEPHMPPLDSARASATLYYTTGDTPADYWGLAAKRAEGNLRLFLGSGGAIKDAVTAAGIPAAAPLPEKLKAAYEWLGANVKNTVLQSAEEEEADDEVKRDTYSARAVLKAKEATPRKLDYLFAGMARALGAEANIVYAVDRTDRFWSQAFKSMTQFDYTFVAVRAPGAPDSDLVFVDAGSGLPYGQLPWRGTGAAALMCTSKGSTSLVVPASPPTTNRGDTHVTLSFADDNESMLIQWARTVDGAGGADYRRWLRDLDVRARKETLDTLCGASGSVEVSAAELPGLSEPSSPFQIACDLERSDMNVGENIGRYSLDVTGPWWPETPEFPAATRVHPVIFDYPRLDILGLDVTAPHGFKPLAVPAPVTLESPFGRYQLVFTKTPTGFHVDRAFALTVLMAKVEDYGALRKFLDGVRDGDRTTVSFERDASAR